MAYIGRDIEYGVLEKQSLTADGTSTDFTLNYGVGSSTALIVSVGGIVQEPDVGYTTSGSTISFATAPATGDGVFVVFIERELITSTAEGIDWVAHEVETGDGSTTQFTLSYSPTQAQDLAISLNGINQTPGTDFTVSGTTLTFSTAPANGLQILIYHLAESGGASNLADSSVTNPKIVSMDASKLTGSLPSEIQAGSFATQYQDLSTLALHWASVDNKVAMNLTDDFFDHFQDDSGWMANNGVDAVANSCLFDSSQSHRLSRGSFQPTSPYTISFWMKRGDIGRTQFVYRIGSADNFGFNVNNTIAVERRSQSLTTTATFASTTDWVHFVVKSESSQCTLYADNVLVGTNSNAANPDSAGTFYIGGLNAIHPIQGHLAEFHYVQGLALDATSFGETRGGLWKPKSYTGSHGSTGFYLDFETANNLGQDKSGNGNDFSLSNLDSSDQTTVSPQPNAVTNTGSSELTYSSNSYTNSHELIDSFPAGNVSGTNGFTLGDHKKAGQCITLSACSISKIGFWVRRVGNISGHVRAEIHGVTGTPGSSATSNGIILARSNAIESASLSTSMHLMLFDLPSTYVHSGGNLWIGIDGFAMDGGGSKYLHMMQNTANGDTNGNAAKQAQNKVWTGYASNDILYYVYGTENLDLKTKGTDALTTVASPASAPTKGHIEALVDDRIVESVPTDSSSSPHTVATFGNVSFSPALKKVGNSSIYFDGTSSYGSYISVADNTDFEYSGDFTIETWVRVTTKAAHQCLFAKGTDADWPVLAYQAYIQQSTGRIFLQVSNNGSATGNVTITTTSDLSDGLWHHVAVVRNGNVWNVYIDGTSEATATQALTILNENNPFSFGSQYTGNYYLNGYMDEIRVSNSARYTANFTPSTTAFTSDSNTKLLIHGDEVVTYPTLNTHVIGEMSRDGGSTWSPVTLARSSTGIDGATTEIFSGDVDFTGDPSGTNVVGRIRTANKHKVTVDGISVNWS